MVKYCIGDTIRTRREFYGPLCQKYLVENLNFSDGIDCELVSGAGTELLSLCPEIDLI